MEMFASVGSQEQPRRSGTTSSLKDLQLRLKQIFGSPVTDADAGVEVILQITEALISGERHGDSSNFRFAHDHGLLAELVGLLGSGRIAPKAVQVQILQTFNMLVQNVRTDKSMEYLFAANCVNRLITTQLDWQNEEILAYYICLLKSLAMRLDSRSLKYFLDAQLLGFPLYTEAVRFFCHRDNMVRAAVRTLTLQIYSVQDDSLHNFILDHSTSTYFVHLACHLCELWVRFDDAVQKQNRPSSTQRQRGSSASVAPGEVNEQQKDLLIYLSDVMELGVQVITESLAEQLLRYCFLPVLLGSLLPRLAENAPATVPTNLAEQLVRDMSIESEKGLAETVCSDVAAGPRLLSPAVSLFLLNQVFSVIRNRAVLEPLAAALLLPSVPAAIEACYSRPLQPFPKTFRCSTREICGPSSSDLANSFRIGGRQGPRCTSSRRHPKPHGDYTEMLAGGLTSAIPNIDSAKRTTSLREHFLLGFSSSCTAQVLLTAGVFHLCATRHRSWLQTLLERARVFPQCPDAAPQSVVGVVGARIVERLGKPPSVEVANSLRDAFDRLDTFLDSTAMDAATLRGRPNVLAELKNVQNLQPLREMHKFNDRDAPRSPSLATTEWETNTSNSTRESTMTSPVNCKVADDCWEGRRSSSQHGLEVLLCVINALERHMPLGVDVVRVLAQLALDLAWNAVDRPDLLTAPVWLAGRVEQAALQNVGTLFRDVPGRDAQIRALSMDGQVELGQPIADLCSNVQWLIEDHCSKSKTEAGKALESLSVVREVHAQLIEYVQNTPPREASVSRKVTTRPTPQNDATSEFHDREHWAIACSAPLPISCPRPANCHRMSI